MFVVFFICGFACTCDDSLDDPVGFVEMLVILARTVCSMMMKVMVEQTERTARKAITLSF